MKSRVITGAYIAAGLFLGSVCYAEAAIEARVSDYVFDKTVKIVFDETAVSVTNGAGDSATVDQNGTTVCVTSEVEGVEVIVSGNSTSGSVELWGDYPQKVTLDGLDLKGDTTAPLSLNSTNLCFVVVAEGTENTLREGDETNTSKGILVSKGTLVLSGLGTLIFEGATQRHAICSTAGSVYLQDGDIRIQSAANDGIHAATDFQMENGTLVVSGSQGDGVDCSGDIAINGGSITVASSTDDIKALKCDGNVQFNGGLLSVTLSGVQSKGIKCTDAAINGGVMMFDLSGAAYLELVQTTVTNSSRVTTNTYTSPSYCTALKCSGNAVVNGGTILVAHSGLAGKGISTDGDFTMNGGLLDFTVSGTCSSTFKNSSGETDLAAADCLTVGGNMTIAGGTVNALATGKAGDGISCEGKMVLGQSGVQDVPILTVATRGQKVTLSGSGMSASYANPKAVKSGGNLDIYGGEYVISTLYDGGEGIESKGVLTIYDGLIEVNAYDDCINAASKIDIRGGQIYCYSTGNDGIDSNGTMEISGGLVIASGTTAPEEGFDCDQNTFKITGGILIGTGGASSTPTSSSCTQRSIVYSGSGTLNTVFQIKSSSGDILVYKIPRNYGSSSGGGGFPGGGGPGGGGGGSMTLLFSSPELASGVSYSIVTGATVSGGTEFHGYYTGATVTGGTTAKTFTASSMVTTVK